MKILLVSPKCPNTFWNLKHALRFISKKAALPPLGLLTVAAMLPKQWDKRFVDMAIENLTDSGIEWADYVFISAMFIQQESAKTVIERCKKLQTKVVAGGPLFTSAHEYFDDVDHLVLNEAEITLPLFLDDLKAGCPKHIYTTQQRADLKQTPLPLWGLVDINKYALMSIQYSRGCPFSCDFCDVTLLFGRKMRTKTTDQILAELDGLYAHKWRGQVFFVDDNFIGNKNHLKNELLPALIDWMEKRKYPFVFNTQLSINLADDDELMHLLAHAGFDAVFVGIETPSQQSLDECGKLQNKNRDLVASVKKIQSFGLQVQGGFILGFDSDHSSTFERLITFIQKSGIVTAMVGLLNAPRGTELYHRLSRANRMLKDASGDNTDFSMNFVPVMNYQELINGYKKVVGTIYSPPYYYERVMTFFKNLQPVQKKKFRPCLRDIKTLIKSMWLLGIKAEGRSYYWKLVLWSFFRRPQLLRLALTFAAYGFHFRKTFSDYTNA